LGTPTEQAEQRRENAVQLLQTTFILPVSRPRGELLVLGEIWVALCMAILAKKGCALLQLAFLFRHNKCYDCVESSGVLVCGECDDANKE
jgi:hypothetical protein